MKRRRLPLLAFLVAILTAAVALFLVADGTVTVPVQVQSTRWEIASVNEVAGAGGDVAGVAVTVYYFSATNALVERATHNLTGAEIVTFMTVTNSPVVGESGSQIKRRRQRVTKALIDLGKISNVTPEL